MERATQQSRRRGIPPLIGASLARGAGVTSSPVGRLSDRSPDSVEEGAQPDLETKLLPRRPYPGPFTIERSQEFLGDPSEDRVRSLLAMHPPSDGRWPGTLSLPRSPAARQKAQCLPVLSGRGAYKDSACRP